MVIEFFAKVMNILHFLIRKIMKVYGIFTRYILVPINIVEYIIESPNDVKISDIY